MVWSVPVLKLRMVCSLLSSKTLKSFCVRSRTFLPFLSVTTVSTRTRRVSLRITPVDCRSPAVVVPVGVAAPGDVAVAGGGVVEGGVAGAGGGGGVCAEMFALHSRHKNSAAASDRKRLDRQWTVIICASLKTESRRRR